LGEREGLYNSPFLLTKSQEIKTLLIYPIPRIKGQAGFDSFAFWPEMEEW